MAVNALHTISQVRVGATNYFTGVSGFAYNGGFERLVQSGDGNARPTFTAIGRQVPRFGFTTTGIATALGISGVTGAFVTSGNVLTTWFQALDEGGTRKTGALQTSLTVNEGLLVPRSLSAGSSSPATLDYECVCGYDGSNAPVVFAASATLAGTSGVSELFVAGPLTVNGTAINGVQQIDVDFGIADVAQSGDGNAYATFLSIQSIAPTVRIRTTDVATIQSLFGVSGLAQSATDTVFYLRKVSEGGTRVADGTSEHVSFTMDEGQVSIDDISGSDGGALEATVVLTPTYDGTAEILVVDTTAAIA